MHQKFKSIIQLEKLTQLNLFIHLPLPRFLITKIAFGVADFSGWEIVHIFIIFRNKVRSWRWGWLGFLVTYGCKKEHLLIFLARCVSKACFMLRCCYDSKIRLAIWMHHNSWICKRRGEKECVLCHFSEEKLS